MKFSVPNQSPWLEGYFNEYLPTTGFLVEIGVGHLINGNYSIGQPFNKIECGSNSYDLIKSGWEALLIDPIKEYCDEASLVYTNEKFYGKVKIECCGISDKVEVLPFYMEDTFIPNGSPIRYDLPYIGRNCNLLPFYEVADKYNIPKCFDLLSIDVEGYELKVLNSIDFDIYQPKLVVVETNIVGTDMVSNILNKHYLLIHRDNLNSLYVRQ
jgi:hypothetical protein